MPGNKSHNLPRTRNEGDDVKFALKMILLALVFPASAMAQDAALELDASRSKISFVSTAPAEKIVGTAEDVSGTVKLNLEKLDGTGKLSFPVEKMNTGNKLRDKHLVGKDWLNAKANPTITFELTSITDTKDVKREGTQVEFTGTANGNVTVNGVSAPSKAEVKVKLDTAKNIARIEPTFKVKLADHKVEGKKGVVGDKVGETIDITGVLYAKVKK